MKTASATVTLRLPAQQKKRLRKLAEATKRSTSFLAADAIQRYLDTEEEFLAAVEKGRADIRAGRFVEHEVVESWLQSWGKNGKVIPPLKRSAKK